MWKYFVLLAVVLVLALYYVYVADPCRNLLRIEFSAKYPGYEILDSAAEEGSPERVRCRIYYRKPDSSKTHDQLWLYQNPGTGWEFSRVIQPAEGEAMPNAAPDERPGQ